MLFHCPIFVIVLGMDEGGFLLPELLTASAVDVSWQGGCIARRCNIRYLLHSTAKAHSAAQQIITAAEIHAQVMIFFCAVCSIPES